MEDEYHTRNIHVVPTENNNHGKLSIQISSNPGISSTYQSAQQQHQPPPPPPPPKKESMRDPLPEDTIEVVTGKWTRYIDSNSNTETQPKQHGFIGDESPDSSSVNESERSSSSGNGRLPAKDADSPEPILAVYRTQPLNPNIATQRFTDLGYLNYAR
eukprot:TCALIF_06001-PA protein Name:"Protein of unknown function" AED:0.00 eAED:0.00 QI:425/1/1/1/0/0.5/2/6/157